MDLLDHVLASVVVACGAILQGSVGFGLGLVSSPLLILIDPSLVPGPLLSASVVLTVLLTHRNRRSILYEDLGWALSGRVLGIIAGATALVIVSPDRIAVVLGLLILLTVGLTASGVHLRPGRSSLFTAGTLSGFTGTTVSIGGPPMALVYQRTDGPRIRGTLSAYFVIGAGLSVVALWWIGRFGVSEVVAALALLPGMMVGFVVSRWSAAVLDRGYIRIAILTVSALAAVVVILRPL